MSSKTEITLFALAVALMFVAAVIMNFLVCFVVYRNRMLRQQFSSVFVVNLAVCDLLMALLAMPFSLGALICSGWPFSRLMCRVTGFVNQCLGISAMLTLVLISLDRYYAVIKPLKYRAKMTFQKALWSVAYIWAQAGMFSVIPAAKMWYGFNERYLFCTFTSNFRNRGLVMFTGCLYLINFCLPLCIMLVAYYKIFKVARRHSQRIAPAVFTLGTFGIVNLVSMRKETGRQREAKAARKILVVIAAFLCCNAPYTTMRLLELASGRSLGLPYTVTALTKWLNFLKSSLNPMIYGLLQRRFRNTLFSIFCRSKSPEKLVVRKCRHVSTQSRNTGSLAESDLQSPASNDSTYRRFWFY